MFFYTANAGEGYNSIIHFCTAFGIAAVSYLLIACMRRKDKLSWEEIGISKPGKNIHSFVLGTLLWLIPACIGLFICLITGWVKLTALMNLQQSLLRVLILYVIVFFMEAFPEELIFRGYYYSRIHVISSHFVTILIQTVLFTAFAFLIGSINSLEQLLFLPGYAIILATSEEGQIISVLRLDFIPH